jgi:hypothetical protein
MLACDVLAFGPEVGLVRFRLGLRFLASNTTAPQVQHHMAGARQTLQSYKFSVVGGNWNFVMFDGARPCDVALVRLWCSMRDITTPGGTSHVQPHRQQPEYLRPNLALKQPVKRRVLLYRPPAQAFN